ncbi:LysR family transcriptional regulator [Promicromonospora sukumoe]|uniref:DNA-binding transcriptional LysR family regulator n=1 Tax=Promicromonospora sukumoe TaxID=88382 RepID=A0A7W3JAU8_9MICO|nr:LysR family transcriptional regulator [Promicromonospora sukumoe]MBA8809418.1 DNA-binding transcriptional LysR family regulator [Promicromonospora sukumoe]
MAELTVTALRVVHAVVGTGSFTATADLLGYTQSAVSRQVAAAESAAGVPLFVRGARGVAPTPAGTLVARRAAVVLAELDAVGKDLAGLDDVLGGRVVLGAFPTATWVLAPRAVAVVRDRHPGLTVDLHEASTPTQLRQLRAGRIDVAVIGMGADLPAYDLDGLRRDHVADGRSLVAVPENHRFAGRDPVPVAELAGEEWLVGKGLRGDPQFGAWPTLPAPKVVGAVREWNARLGLVAAGLGITTVPELVVPALPAGVVTVRVDDPAWLGRAAVAVTRPDRPAGVDAVVGALREVARELG